MIFALDEDLANARIKDPGLRWQRLVLLMGVLIAIVRRVTDRVMAEELHLDFTFLVSHQSRKTTPLEPERQLLNLLLREWRERGIAQVNVKTLRDVANNATEEARRSVVQVTLCSQKGLDERWRSLDPDSRIMTASLELANTGPLLLVDRSPIGERERESIEGAWRGVSIQLLEHVA